MHVCARVCVCVDPKLGKGPCACILEHAKAPDRVVFVSAHELVLLQPKTGSASGVQRRHRARDRGMTNSFFFSHDHFRDSKKNLNLKGAKKGIKSSACHMPFLNPCSLMGSCPCSSPSRIDVVLARCSCTAAQTRLCPCRCRCRESRTRWRARASRYAWHSLFVICSSSLAVPRRRPAHAC